MAIQQFYTQATNKDFARLFQFRLMSFGNITLPAEDYLYIETASLPGKTINNIQVPYMGLQFNVPGTVSFPGSAGYAVTFRCDQNYDIRALLETAMINTFDHQTSTGQYFIHPQGTVLQMELLDKGRKPVRTYTLHGVYIQSLADTTYDIKDNGAIATINATLAYQYWEAASGGSTQAAPSAKLGSLKEISMKI
jgi:hypothetical protein